MISSPNLNAQVNATEVEHNHPVSQMDMTIIEAILFAHWLKQYSFFTGPQKLVPVNIDGVPTNEPLLPNDRILDVRHCTYSGNIPQDGHPPKTSCKAKLILNCPSNYNPQKLPISLESVEKSVKVTWHWQHNHDADRILSKEMEHEMYVLISQGFCWRALQNRIEIRERYHNIRPEPIGVQYFHYSRIKKTVLRNLGVKNRSIATSLKLWAKELKCKGMAEFKDESGFLEENPSVKEFKTEQGMKVWSFSLMSNWQKILLKKEGRTIYLDSTPITCGGLDKKENVYLFTIFVNNRITREECPAAFLITNSQDYIVVADFLKQVKEFTNIEPTRVAIDCEDSEKRAFESVWPKIKVILRRWHIDETFRRNIRSQATTSIPWQELKKLQNQIKDEFNETLECSTIADGKRKLKSVLYKYREYSQIIDYLQEYWLQTKKTLVSKNQIPLAIDTIFITRFLLKLRGRYLLGRRKSRPDVLVYELFIHVLRVYQRDQISAWNSYIPRRFDQTEKRAMAKAEKITEEDIPEKIIPQGLCFTVYSFTRKTMFYDVTFEDRTMKRAKCDCEDWKESLSWCKHIFLVLRWQCRLPSYIREREYDIKCSDSDPE